MIRSKKQYDITKKHFANFTEHLKELERIGREDFIHPIIHQARKDAVQSQIDVFTDDLMEWEKSKVYSEEEAKAMAWESFWMATRSYGNSPILIERGIEKITEKFNNLWKELTK